MKFPQVLLSIGLLLSACHSADAQDANANTKSPVPANAILSPQQVREDVELAHEAFSRVHPGYTRYATELEMDQAWDAIIRKAEANGGMPLERFYLAAELALTQIRCDHTKAELPKSLRDARKGKPLYLPLLWTLVEGRGLIAKAHGEVPVNYGDEIIAIDGRALSEITSEVAPYVPVDGYTQWSRNAGISQSREFMGGAVDHFGALLWEVPAVASVIVRNAEGVDREVQMARISFVEWSAMGDAKQANFKDSVTFERLSDQTAYLRVDTFVNYREPVKPRKILQPIFKTIRDEGYTKLILDLRNNGGGSADAQYELLANLIDRPFKPIREMRAQTLDLDGIRPYLWTWDKRALNPNPFGFSKNDDGTFALRSFVSSDLRRVKPAKYAFTGELIALTSTTNSSGSTNMIAWLTEMERVTTIGEKTGGSAEGPTAGLQFTLTLPNSGVKMRLPFFHVLNNISKFEHGLGLSPDIRAPMTVADFRAGLDPALEKAKTHKALPKR